MNSQERLQDYLNWLRKPFVKLVRARFLNSDGSTAFVLDGHSRNTRSGAFIADGEISVNLQNGQRRTSSLLLRNDKGNFDFSMGKIWYGQEIAIDMGLTLSDGTPYYHQMGLFLIDTPDEEINPGRRMMSYRLVDKWANLDGTLYGNLESTYSVPVGVNIFSPIAALLAEDRGNGLPVDRITPVFTEYYNARTQTLPDGGVVAQNITPYTLEVEAGSGTIGEVALGLCEMINGWIGYDNTGTLRVDPSQDDISDKEKPVLWRFSPRETQLLGLTYTLKNTEVYNDYIVTGEMLDNNIQPAGRAQNLDPSSDSSVGRIGRKTVVEARSDFVTSTQCRDYAAWKLKRSAVLQKAVTIRTTPIFHLRENDLIEIVRTDKPGSPVERHVVQGFTIPFDPTEPMEINAISVEDYPAATLQTWPLTAE